MVDETTPEQHIVVAALLRRRGRVLMVHRSPRRRWYPDTWDLPGGHAAPGRGTVTGSEPTNRTPLEHDALAWLTDQDLEGLALADARLPALLRMALDEAP